MGNWFESNLGDAMLANEAMERIKAIFLIEFESTECPNEMAIFFRHESEGHLHCEVKVYFSPAAAVAAKKSDAVRCVKPFLSGLSLLAGSEESWSLFFPGQN